MVSAQDHREKSANISDALSRLAAHPKFLWFCEQSLLEMEGEETVKRQIDDAMAEHNLEVYIQKDGAFISEKTGEPMSPLVEKLAQ